MEPVFHTSIFPAQNAKRVDFKTIDGFKGLEHLALEEATENMGVFQLIVLY